MTDFTNDPNDEITSGEMTPGRAAFETWYGSMAAIQEVTPEAWASLGEHQAVWDRVAAAAIMAHEEG
jgi:hypothetical protein